MSTAAGSRRCTSDKRYVDIQRGPWRLTRRLGRGATASVWLARTDDGRQAAFKLLGAADDRDTQRLLATELTALGRLRHPLTPRLLWVGDDGYAMEYVRGRPLDRERTFGRAPLERALPLLLDLLDVLIHAHGLGVIHRDLKPANLIVTRMPALPDGTVTRLTVVDFGLAVVRAVDALGRRELAGTPAYMAPEQRMGRRVDGRADLYAVGAIARSLMGAVVSPFDELLAERPEDRPGRAEDVIARVVEVYGPGDSPLARPPGDRPPVERVQVALGSARVPSSLERALPTQRLGSFLQRERDLGRLRRVGRTWSWDATLTGGDALQRDGRLEDAAAAYVREGKLLEAADLHQRRQEYETAVELLRRAERGGQRQRARLQLGVVLREMGRLDEAVATLADLRRRSRGELRARVALEEGYALEAMGRLAEAEQRLQQGLELARRVGDVALEARALQRLGIVALRRGRLQEAEPILRDALAAVRADGAWDAVAAVLNEIGVACEKTLRLDEAADSYEQALDACRRFGDRKGTITLLVNLGNVETRRLELGRARDHYHEARTIAAAIGSAIAEAAVLIALSVVEATGGRFREAHDLADTAVAQCETLPYPSLLALALRNRGDASWRQNPDDTEALAGAERDFLRARDIADANEDLEVAIETEIDLAEIATVRGFLVQAGHGVTDALGRADTHGYRELSIRARVVLAMILNRCGLGQEALAEAETADQQATSAGTALLGLQAIVEQAKALRHLGREREAEAARERAEAIAESLRDAAR